jgi:methionyl-tRNA formyltransferase
MKSGKDLRIVFMGTPEFAVASLNALVNAGFNIVGVITAPDKPAGRGMHLQQSAVKKYAVEKGLTVLQPEKLKNPQFLEALKTLNADLQVVVAFRMLPELVWNMPPMGTINLHASLLPDYRGAAPINWAVIDGAQVTGVTTFKLKHEIDTGDVLLQEKIPLTETETAGELHDRMKLIGAELLVKTVEGLAAGTLKEQPQDKMNTSDGTPKHAPKLTTETSKIDWNKPAREIYNLIRGLSPYPAAFTHIDGKMLKIYRAAMVNEKPEITPGEYKLNPLRFAAVDGYIEPTEVQLEGKKRMSAEDFLRGYRKS